MKKNLKFMAMAAAAIVLAACNGKVEKFETVDVAYADSLSRGGSRAVCEVEVDYPKTADAFLLDNITGWFATQINDYASLQIDSLAEGIDGNAFAKAVCDAALKEAYEDFAGFEKEGFNISYDYAFEFEEEYLTDKFVTYTADIYTYKGGAHGNSLEVGSVYGLKDGIQYGWDLLEEASLPAVLELVKKGLLDYFDAEEGQAIDEFIFGNSGEMALPVSAPYFTEDGVKFIYQQYEIAPYAAGKPSCTIPYKDMMNYLSPAGKALL